MMDFYKESIEHLENKNLNYGEHLTFSLYLSSSLFVCSIKSLVHGFIPSFFKTSTTDLSESLHYKLNKKQN